MLIPKSNLFIKALLSNQNEVMYYHFTTRSFTNKEISIELKEDIELEEIIKKYLIPILFEYYNVLKSLEIYIQKPNCPFNSILTYSNKLLKTFIDQLNSKKASLQNNNFNLNDPIKYVYTKEDKVKCPICNKEITLDEDLNILNKCEHYIDWQNDIRTYEKMFMFNSEINLKDENNDK